MHIACSTLCFASLPLDQALRQITNLEFAQTEIAMVEDWAHINPSEIAQDISSAARMIRMGPNLTPTSFYVVIGTSDEDQYLEQLEACCKLAKMLTVSLITIPTAAADSDFESEVTRLRRLASVAGSDGITLSIENDVGSLAQDPAVAVQLCEAVPDLGLTLDPSHYINGPFQNDEFGEVMPYVRHVQLRDSGTAPDQRQVPIGQGLIEYGKITSQLNRFKYNRALSIEIIDSPEYEMDVEAEVRKLKLLLETLA